jgi:hypothetical protein
LSAGKADATTAGLDVAGGSGFGAALERHLRAVNRFFFQITRLVLKCNLLIFYLRRVSADVFLRSVYGTTTVFTNGPKGICTKGINTTRKTVSKKSTTCDALICFLLTITHVIFMNEYVKQPFVKKHLYTVLLNACSHKWTSFSQAGLLTFRL